MGGRPGAEGARRGAVSPRRRDDVLARRPGADVGEWETVLVVGAEDAYGTRIVGFSGDGRGLYLLSSVGAKATRLVHLDLDRGAMEVLAEDPRYDLASVTLHPDTCELQLVSIIRERVEHSVHDPAIEADIGGDPGDPAWRF